MKKPQMILFDYGHTLLYEPGFDARRCEEAAFAYITRNPQNLNVRQIYAEVQKLFAQFHESRNNGIEIHEWQFMRLIYEYLGIQFCISYPELEEIEWNAASKGAVMPHVEAMLDYLNKSGIRTAVISNIGWSGQALTNRINRLLPDNQFEFIIASSEYAIRKPNKMLFELALRKAGLSAKQVWYCGDSITYDGIEVDFDYLHIHDWLEMVEILDAAASLYK